MQELNLPTYEYRLQREGGQVRIFDPIRKKYVALTPEEWVRQHFINYLLTEKSAPAGLMILEKKIIMNTMTRRPDILVYDKKGEPVLIVECKSPEVAISQDTFDQIARYNSVIRASYLVVTNGLQHYCCKMAHEDNSYQFLEDVPNYADMTR
jgi:hypothetical protein